MSGCSRGELVSMTAHSRDPTALLARMHRVCLRSLQLLLPAHAERLTVVARACHHSIRQPSGDDSSRREPCRDFSGIRLSRY